MTLITSVSRAPKHDFSKVPQTSIRLLAGLGVEGDAHMGATVKHRWRKAQDPMLPNLCQVHLMAAELHDELVARGYAVGAGLMGENVTTRGLNLLCLPRGTRLRLGASATVEVTGLREPCKQLDKFQPGLMAAVLERSAAGTLIRQCGIMAIVAVGGEVRAGDSIEVTMPPEPHLPLECV